MTCKQTQKAQVLALLKRGWTTAAQCYMTINVMTLSQRCTDLRRDGHKVISERVPGKSYHRYRVIVVKKG